MTGTPKLSADWLRWASTIAIFDALGAGGHQVYAVGGCVRDTLLDRPVADVDFATDARPERVIELAARAGLKAIPTGIEHGTITVVARNRPHEVTTFRRDIATDGRRATVAFSDDIATDAARRDFTINALYADTEGQVHDPVSGLRDIPARCVRFIGEPEARIREDALRILRFFRFFATLGNPGSEPDAQGLAACRTNARMIQGLSAERIGAEMRKLLAAADPGPATAAMGAADVLARILPGADPGALCALLRIEGHTPPRWLRRLAALGATGADEALRLSRKEARRLEELDRATKLALPPAHLGFYFDAEIAVDATLLAAARSSAQPPADLARVAERGARQSFPVAAADLTDRIPPGPELGAALRRLTEHWVASDFALTREALIDLADDP